MRLVLAVLPTVLVAMLATQPASAATAQPSLDSPGESQARLVLVSHNGYLVTVEGRGRKVLLSVEKGLSAATYVTRGRVSPNRIRARFGNLGLVSVRFRSTDPGRRIRPPRGCKGNPAIERLGVFVGRIRFRGEDGYLGLRARRALGRSRTLPRWRCRRETQAHASARQRRRRVLEKAELTASTPNERTVFSAFGIREVRRSERLVLLFVSSKERRGSVRVGRFMLLFTDRGRSFAFAEDGKSAVLRPPKPFHGTASFDRRAPGPERWTGTLSVSLPGATVDLTGPLFRAHLEFDRWTPKPFWATAKTGSPLLSRFHHLVAP